MHFNIATTNVAVVVQHGTASNQFFLQAALPLKAQGLQGPSDGLSRHRALPCTEVQAADAQAGVLQAKTASQTPKPGVQGDAGPDVVIVVRRLRPLRHEQHIRRLAAFKQQIGGTKHEFGGCLENGGRCCPVRAQEHHLSDVLQVARHLGHAAESAVAARCRSERHIQLHVQLRVVVAGTDENDQPSADWRITRACTVLVVTGNLTPGEERYPVDLQKPRPVRILSADHVTNKLRGKGTSEEEVFQLPQRGTISCADCAFEFQLLLGLLGDACMQKNLLGP
mmetsp:Transcript_174318/g.558792  ORF Transcript_174318/g.558792 Transcript_174318/m.558792 type:complete len:281 (-) Transcript_174318:1090-1932(-)